MADIGLRSGKVRSGFYRCGKFCIHKGPHGLGVYEGPRFIQNFNTLNAAYNWARYDGGCSP